MKTTALLVLAAICVALCAQGQTSPAMDWSTIDGGGGTSAGGQYSVTGTLGQPDTGQMRGGSYTLVGGFWSIVAAVQTPGAPFLSIWSTDTNTVVVSWPAPSEGWLLQATTDLVTGGGVWTEIAPPYQGQGRTNLFFVEPMPAGHRFYRLHKP